MKEELNVALIQSDTTWENKMKNITDLTDTLLALKEKADIIVLPEMFNTGFTMEPAAVAEKMDGFTVGWMKEMAAEMKTVICGSLIIEDDGFVNRLVWMPPDGNAGVYDKRHLFRMGNEHLRMKQGNGRMIVELDGWKVLPLICYDLRFPVWSMNQYEDEKYAFDCMIYVANWPAVRSNHWKSLMVARAIENQAYLIGVNRVGKDGNGYEYSGDSAAIDFKGNYLAKLQRNREIASIVTLSYSKLYEFRDSFQVRLDWDRFEVR